MNTDNDYLGNPSDILVTTHVLEEDLRDVIALEFKDFWHPKLRITPNELVITGSTVSTEHQFAHHKPFTLTIAPFRIRHNIISFHIYDIHTLQYTKLLDHKILVGLHL